MGYSTQRNGSFKQFMNRLKTKRFIKYLDIIWASLMCAKFVAAIILKIKHNNQKSPLQKT